MGVELSIRIWISIAEKLFNVFLSSLKDLARYQSLQLVISRLEGDAEKSRSDNRELMTSYSKQLKMKSHELGSTLEQVRPYFEQKKRIDYDFDYLA